MASLLITVFIECVITYFLYKSKQFAYYIFSCNLLTNPLLNLVTTAVGLYFYAGIAFYISIFICEIAVVLL